jgi:formylglycine-generating enzyme required for sulfatase activity
VNEKTKNNKMKKVIYLILLLPLIYASKCTTVEGNLVGVRGRGTFYPDVLGPGKMPLGMVYVPSQGYQSGGQDDQDIMGLHTARTKTVSIQALYMDATEISNNEYRQFVHWVRDSIAREKLYRRSYDEDAERWVSVPDNFFREPYRTLVDMGSDVQGGNTPFQIFNDTTNNAEFDKTVISLLGGNTKKIKANQVVNGLDAKKELAKNKDFFASIKNKTAPIQDVTISDLELRSIFMQYSADKKTLGKKTKAGDFDFDASKMKDFPVNQGGRIENRKYFTLNWEEPIEYSDPVTSVLLSDMYYSREERFNNRREIDTRLLFYDYYWIDYQEAARRGKILTKSVDARETYSYEKVVGGTDVNNQTQDNFYLRSKREPLGKDYKQNDLHRSTLDASGNLVWLDTTIYQNSQWNNKDGDKDLSSGNPNQVDRNSYMINDLSNVYKTSLKNPGQDLDLGYTNSKGQHNALRGHTDRSRFIIKERINVYPDTLCWVRDFTYSFHDPMTQNYFWNTAYDNYPVVGVTWSQAKAFSVWRTQIYHTWLHNNDEVYVNDFRLPTESEWEGAARGSLDLASYPWGGPYIRNAAGCFMANFKPMRGRYFEDGGFHTVKVYSYNPNAYGLYCMAGNVSEWCASTFDESMYEFAHDLNSNYDYQALDGDHPAKKKKVLRGGSWKDIGYYLLNGTRTFEYQDSAKSYIGFRNVMTHLGRGGNDIDQENGEEIQSDIQLK